MLNELYEKVEAVLNGLDVGGEQSHAFEGEIGILKEILSYPEPVQDDWDECQRREVLSQKLRRLAVEAAGVLIPLPKNPVTQWFDGTYQDTNIDMYFEEVDLARLLRFIIDVGLSYDAESSDSKATASQMKATLREQSPDHLQKSVELSLLTENGQLWIQPKGYGEKCTEDGEGSPVGMEIWQGHFRLVVFDDINSEEPKIIDLENAKESSRINSD
ncbi:MAG: hypothetical protein PHF37_04510 [Phycisphaerae bacterium]|nr:hypothetical protein [Phycisphaerae bacterium]